MLYAACIHMTGCDAPRLEMNEKAHDFGIIQPGSTHEHVFKFKNTGGATLIIQKIHAG